MQEEQQRVWADQVRKQEAKQLAVEHNTSEAMESERNDFGSDWKGLSNHGVDSTIENADWVYDFRTDPHPRPQRENLILRQKLPGLL